MCAGQGLKVTALVIDSEGVPIALISGDGAAAITQRIASGKATTALKMKMTSGEAGDRAKTDQAFMAQLMADPAMGTPRQGGVPLMAGNDIVGAFAVSGAPSGAPRMNLAPGPASPRSRIGSIEQIPRRLRSTAFRRRCRGEYPRRGPA